MAKSLYIGVDGKARKVKAMWIGVDGVARKVKAGFIGVVGIAREFFSGEKTVTKESSISLYYPRQYLTGLHFNNYAVFAGGSGKSLSTVGGMSFNDNTANGANGFYKTIDRINSSLTRNSQITISIPCDRIGSASNDKYALFIGGFYRLSNGDYNVASKQCDAFNTSWTKSSVQSIDRYNKSGGNVGNYLLFAGGQNANGYSTSDVQAYSTANSSLTQSTATALSNSQDAPAIASVGSYCIVAAAYKKTEYDFYNSSLTHSYKTAGRSGGFQSCGFSFNNYAVFGGMGSNDDCNLGFFAQTADGKTYPASNLADSGIVFAQSKLFPSWINTAQKELTTICVLADGNILSKKTSDLSSISNLKTAVSGIPIISDGTNTTMDTIRSEGYFGNEIYDTWHGFLTYQGQEIVYFAAKAGTLREMQCLVREIGYGNNTVIKLDGGGSFVLCIDGEIIEKTDENRKIDSIGMFE